MPKKKEKPSVPEPNIGSAIINLAVDLKVSEVRRMIEVLDHLNIPELKPALETFQARIREMEGLRVPQDQFVDWQKDWEEYERRERLLNLKK